MAQAFVRMHLERVEDGKARWIDYGLMDNGGQGDLDNIRWYFTEGNMGCDCNRELYWRRSEGEPDSEIWDSQENACGDEERFRMLELDLRPVRR